MTTAIPLLLVVLAVAMHGLARKRAASGDAKGQSEARTLRWSAAACAVGAALILAMMVADVVQDHRAGATEAAPQ